MGNDVQGCVAKGTCGVLPQRALVDIKEEACGLCGEEDVAPNLTGPHPLLQDEPTGRSTTPQTPRGPRPPWAASLDIQAIDLTATGPTPPRSPTPPRLTPPGLPDDEDQCSQDPLDGSALAASFDDRFVQDLFRAARSGNSGMLSSMLHQVNGGAFTLVAAAFGPFSAASFGLDGAGKSGQQAADRREKSGEMVASFLSNTRAPGQSSRETLLGAACNAGQLEAVQLLLTAKADPSVADSSGSVALHRASESGRLLSVLMILDRLQATARAISVTDLANCDGETPEMLAALGGASDVCRGFEIFGDLQNDAELRQLGSSSASTDFAGSRHNGGTGDLLGFLDLEAELASPTGLATSSLLRGCGIGNGLVRDLHMRIPEDQADVFSLVDRVCCGIRRAEEILLGTTWNPADPELDPALRTFVCTAEVRASWQLLRAEAVQSERMPGLEDFWQTHLTADIMVTTLMNARNDTFQLLLTVLWLYTREAWLRHIVDTLAGALAAGAAAQVGSSADVATEGATGAAPTCTLQVPTLRSLPPLVEALSPLMQMVQSALFWFEEAGIKHSGMTYRPLSLPLLSLQRLIDRYIAARQDEGEKEEHRNSRDGKPLASGAWVSLGAGAFFSTTSSRAEAVRRLARTRSNVLLVIRPDERDPCFPKQMSLRGSSVDDVLFPLGAVFRIAKITRAVSSDLVDPEACSGLDNHENGSRGPWPVMIFELSSASHCLEMLEVLEHRGDLGLGELELRLQEWINGAIQTEKHERLLAAGELLARCAGEQSSCPTPHIRGDSGGGSSSFREGSRRIEKATLLLLQSVREAELSANHEVNTARALLSLARCRLSGRVATTEEVAADGKRAIALLTQANGTNHPETCAARTAWRELGVRIPA